MPKEPILSVKQRGIPYGHTAHKKPPEYPEIKSLFVPLWSALPYKNPLVLLVSYHISPPFPRSETKADAQNKSQVSEHLGELQNVPKVLHYESSDESSEA